MGSGLWALGFGFLCKVWSAGLRIWRLGSSGNVEICHVFGICTAKTLIERSPIENHLSTMPPVSSSESMALAGIPKALHGLDKESFKWLAWQLKGEESTRRKKSHASS